MPALSAIVSHLDRYLDTDSAADYPGAHNGLQLENSGKVQRVAAAVDACEPVIAEAVQRGVSLLVVHHGLLWTPQKFTGGAYRKMRAAIAGDLAIYSSHLPLDRHPVVGNNALLAKALGIRKWEPAFPYKGQNIGLTASVSIRIDELAARLERALGCSAHLCAGGPAKTRRIGIITGGAGSEVAQAVAAGCDTFITGEGPHWSYTAAEELGINVFYGGHYATETFGVKAVAELVAKKFRIPWEFIDHPTGL